MGLTPTERKLILARSSLHLFASGDDIDRQRWDAYLVLLKEVEAERKAAGLLPWPNPPIPKPARTGNAMTLLLKNSESPHFLELPLIDQDAWFFDMCALDAVLALLLSPGFDALPAREQIAALFGRWPESQGSDHG